jgi:hypothetical protein
MEGLSSELSIILGVDNKFKLYTQYATGHPNMAVLFAPAKGLLKAEKLDTDCCAFYQKRLDRIRNQKRSFAVTLRHYGFSRALSCSAFIRVDPRPLAPAFSPCRWFCFHHVPLSPCHYVGFAL